MRGRIDFKGGSEDIDGNIAIDGNLTLTGGGQITTTSNGNINLLPNGTGITKVGDAGSTSNGLNTNDDCFISGKLEVDGTGYFDGSIVIANDVTLGSNGRVIAYGSNTSFLLSDVLFEEVTVPVGSGLDPVVVSSSNLCPANSTIKAVAVRVTQAPGGGATTVSVGRTSGNIDEFIDAISTALGTTGNHIANNDGDLTVEDMWNAAANTLTISTDADVTGTAMKIRIVVWYDLISAPAS